MPPFEKLDGMGPVGVGHRKLDRGLRGEESADIPIDQPNCPGRANLPPRRFGAFGKNPVVTVRPIAMLACGKMGESEDRAKKCRFSKSLVERRAELADRRDTFTRRRTKSLWAHGVSGVML